MSLGKRLCLPQAETFRWEVQTSARCPKMLPLLSCWEEGNMPQSLSRSQKWGH